MPARICLTVHKFGRGGTERVCAHLARGFAEAGFDTTIVAFCSGGEAEAPLHALAGENVVINYLGRSSGSRPVDLIGGLVPFIRFLRRAQPVCVIATGNNMNWITALAVRAARLKDCKLVLKTTNPIIRPGDSSVARLWRNLGYRHAFAAADAVWTLSDAETDQLRTEFAPAADRIATVINPYVTPAMFAPSGEPAKQAGAQIIAVGRLSAQKRLDLLVRAFAMVRHADAHLTILGEGGERPALEALITERELTDRVSLAGFVADVGAWYRRADLLVMPSVYEGLPAVVLEAMAANCPVLATDCFASARQLLERAQGCAIIDQPEPAELAGQIDRSLSQPRPTTLSRVAAEYSIAAGLRSHVSSLLALLG